MRAKEGKSSSCEQVSPADAPEEGQKGEVGVRQEQKHFVIGIAGHVTVCSVLDRICK